MVCGIWLLTMCESAYVALTSCVISRHVTKFTVQAKSKGSDPPKLCISASFLFIGNDALSWLQNERIPMNHIFFSCFVSQQSGIRAKSIESSPSSFINPIILSLSIVKSQCFAPLFRAIENNGKPQLPPLSGSTPSPTHPESAPHLFDIPVDSSRSPILVDPTPKTFGEIFDAFKPGSSCQATPSQWTPPIYCCIDRRQDEQDTTHGSVFT